MSVPVNQITAYTHPLSDAHFETSEEATKDWALCRLNEAVYESTLDDYKCTFDSQHFVEEILQKDPTLFEAIEILYKLGSACQPS